MAKLVSKTYGDALFELALEENHLDEILDDEHGQVYFAMNVRLQLVHEIMNCILMLASG